MKLSAHCVFDDGTMVLIETRPADIMQWEAGGKRRVGEGMGYTDMLQIIYAAAKRQNITDRPFTDWVTSLEDFDPVIPEQDPTKTGQPTTA